MKAVSREHDRSFRSTSIEGPQATFTGVSQYRRRDRFSASPYRVFGTDIKNGPSL
ncbi:hypothetical protein SAMN04487946_1181 [Halobellus clavatus]|uniref:Uncharacterized protein n=1 Tax=Halobellus clavatus TaxID=660517 RepID=A0A1H3K8U4_9EURY|nr:hypothetical protein SAMN04487946_1181 [Halobellus clavatus]